MSRKFGAFDPASTATTTVTTGVVDTSAVVLYLPFDEDVQDDSGVGTSMTAVGNAFVQSSLTQFGAKALYLDGSGDYLQSVQKSSANSIFTLSSAAFTIDGWLYPQTFNEVISNFNASSPFAGFTASLNFTPHAAGKLAFFTSDGSNYDVSMASSTAFALNQWSHFAIVRGAISANSLEFFINGVKHGSHTVTREPGTSNNVVRIGASNNSQPNRQFRGAMDDLRIIKGVALYSTNFSVPTTAVGNSIFIGSSTENTRTHSHVWNYPDIYKARRADTWPAVPATTRPIQIHVAGGGGGGGGQNAGGDGGDGGVVSVQKTGVTAGTILTYVVGGGGKGGFYGVGRSSGQVIGITSGPMAGGGALVASDGDLSSYVNQSGAEGGAGSGVFLTTATQANAIVIAGGGGGGAGNNNGEGGAGGGQGTASDSSLVGQDGQGGANQGEGGQSSRGGRHGNGTSPRTTAGALLGQTNIYGGSGYTSGGGGGGGYYGGGGGGHGDSSDGIGGAGGGSGYVSSEWTRIASTLSLPAGGAHATTGADGANGKVVIIVDGSTAVSVTSTGTTATYEVV